MESIFTKEELGEKEQQMENYYYFTDALTDEEIEKILKLAEDIKEEQGVIGKKLEVERSYRNSKIKWLDANEDNKWLYEKMADYVKKANKTLWNYDIIGFGEGFQLGTYVAENKGHYDWHMDCDSSNSFRKISISVQLSDPSEYEGGELQLYTKRNTTTLPKEKGTAIFFSSFILHRVTPITKGKRMSLVAWVTGPQFR